MPVHTPPRFSRIALLLGALFATSLTTTVQAADWSDTYIGYRTGTHFAEPYKGNNITKNIFNVSHASGYAYGTNFFNVDFLISNSKDPGAVGSTDGAQEAYIVYRNTVDLSKVTGASLGFGPVKSIGITGGFDLNSKNDTGYNSKKRMLVLGPTLIFNLPAGFLDISLLMLNESNAPYNGFTHVSTPRYTYRTHPMLAASWGIPLSSSIPLSFEGFANFITAKGANEFGGGTAPETNIDMRVMYDVSSLYGKKGSLKVGLEYQYWRNKFGNTTTPTGLGAGPGATAKTPMLRAEYHF